MRSLLLAHQAADATEAAHRDRMLDLLDDLGAGDPFSRRRYDPGHFTASAFVLSPDGGSLLLVHHRKLRLWVQPGGHMDPGDPSPVAAARREAIEEAGPGELTETEGGLFDVDVHTFHAHGDQPTHLHYDLRFLFRAATYELRPGAEVAGARWVPLHHAGVAFGDVELARPVAKLRT